ncbi:hypothetical protein ACLB2K_037882 [Fragaria x ananassa]
MCKLLCRLSFLNGLILSRLQQSCFHGKEDLPQGWSWCWCFQEDLRWKQEEWKSSTPFCESNGAIARHILQQLEDVKIVETDPKGKRRSSAPTGPSKLLYYP